MLIAKIQRMPTTDEGTFGVLSFGKQVLYSLELPWRDNLPKVSCIPPGAYHCDIVQSPKFGRVYEVQNVYGRSHVLIHPANLAGDAALGWTTQLEGCIAPAQKLGKMRNNAGNMQAAGLLSRPAVNTMMAWAAGQPFTLEILP